MNSYLKKLFYFVSVIFIILSLFSCFGFDKTKKGLVKLSVADKKEFAAENDPIIDFSKPNPEFYSAKFFTRSKLISEKKLVLVKLSGRVNHFGYNISVDPPTQIPFEQNVPEVNIWIDEYPFTKYLNLKTDEKGFWTLWIIKKIGLDINFSFIYEKEGWITTKSNVIPVTDEDNTDLAVQFIDPFYYNFGVKPTLEKKIKNYFGRKIQISNAVVATIGKAWASLHDSRLPHGDPGAKASVNPDSGFIGPIYFNDNVEPDLKLRKTTFDGGMVLINPAFGIYEITASKQDVNYKKAVFKITEEDAKNGVVLYIASPPDSIEGTNTSEPGEK